jgi:hypothetical protein
MNPTPCEPENLKKGDRVECSHNGKPLYGAILKINGGIATMVLDGGKQSVSGAVGNFKRSAHPLPDDPVASPADRWTISGFHPSNGRDDCVAFEATLCRDGEPVLRAYNSGIQDRDQLSPLGDHSRMDVVEFSAAVKAWLAANGMAQLANPVHLWISWYVEKRPFGVPAGAFLRDAAKRQR